MFCAPQRKFSDLSLSLDRAALEQRLPYTGSLELTYRCNLACRHCYCNLPANDRRRADEMATSEVKRILDEAADAGCLWLLLTGGEVLLREDFGEIYLHAVRKGMLVQVFTNATLIDGETAAGFAEFPPLGIDVTIYGSVPRLHDAVTGVEGSFERTIAGIERLRSRDVKVSLKTVLMTLNYADLAGMRGLAASLGVEFRYDTLVCPRIDGGMDPVQYRLPAGAMAELDLGEDPAACEKVFDGFWNRKPDEDFSVCGGGVFGFNIDPCGVLSPCTMFRSFRYPLRGVPFARAWKELTAEYARRKTELVPSECASCSMQLICSTCPGLAEIEERRPDKKVAYTCDYAKSLERKFFEQHPEKESLYGKKTLSET